MKRVYLGLLVLIAAFLAPTVYALPIGKADSNLTVNDDYNDTAFFAGNTVNVNSKIDGLGFVAGNNVNVKGEADYGFIAGNSININEYSSKDIFVAGNSITINNSSLRTIYAAATTIVVNSNAKTLYVAGSDVTIEGTFDDVVVDAENFNFKGTINGTLKINEDAKTNIASDATVVNKETYKADGKVNKESAVKAMFITNIFAKLISKLLHFLNIVIIGLIFIALFKKTNNRIKDMKVDVGYVFANFGFGLLVLIATPIISIILMFTGIASALGIIGLVVYFLALYLSEIIGSMYIARKALPNMNEMLAFILVTFIVTVASIVPILGGLVSLFFLCMSLGLIVELIKTEIKGK